MELKPIALVIEDNEDLNAIFTSAPEKAGYIVQSVYNGASAKELLTEIVPAIITLDLHMPGMSDDAVLKYWTLAFLSCVTSHIQSGKQGRSRN